MQDEHGGIRNLPNEEAQASTNDAVYQELMRYKRDEENRRNQTMSDSRTVTDFMMEKRKRSDDASSVVSSRQLYTENAEYKRINTNSHPGINVSYCLHPLSPDECDVHASMVEDSPAKPNLVMMPNHCINGSGEAEGFRFSCKADCQASALPINREMFFRHSLVECKPQSDDLKGESRQILGMLMDKENIKQRLSELVQRIRKESVGEEAMLDCIADNENDLDDDKTNMASLGSYLSQKVSDTREWSPEVTTSVGIYHAYVKGFANEQRTHKLFLACTGGCSRIADVYFNLFVDTKNHTSCKTLCEAEETWFLNKVNQRNNARLLLRVANEFSLDIPTTRDQNAYTENATMAACTTETLINSIQVEPSGMVRVYNNCTDTRQAKNGTLFSIDPSEGMWLFRGPPVTKNCTMPYGGGFGMDESRGPSAFPVATNDVRSNYSFSSLPPKGGCMERTRMGMVHYTDSDCVARFDARGEPWDVTTTKRTRTQMDENYIHKLSSMQWNRDNGYLELIPIAVVVSER